MATRKKTPAKEDPKEGSGAEGLQISPTMPYYCTWLPNACPPQEDKAEAQTILAPTLPPFCPITVAQALGAHAQTLLSAPPNCPTVQQCPPQAGAAQVQGPVTVTAATQCTQPPGCPIGVTGWQTCPPGCIIGPTGWQGCHPTMTTTVQNTAQARIPMPTTTIIHTTNPTAATRCFICPPTGTATTTVQTIVVAPAHAQVATAANCVHATTYTQLGCQINTVVTAPPGCNIIRPTTTTDPTALTHCFICPPDTATTTVQTIAAAPQAQAVRGGTAATVCTQFGCVHNTLLTSPPNCTGIQTATGCPHPTTYTQLGCPINTVVTVPPGCPSPINTLPPACPITGPTICPPSVGCPGGTGPQPALVTAPPNCGGIHTNGCPIGQTGWLTCGHTYATVCTQTGCPQPTLQTQVTCPPQITLLTAPPNCGGIQTNVCTGTGPQPAVLTAPPNCGGIHTNGCPVGQTGWLTCGQTYATVCTQTGCPQPTLQTQIACPPQITLLTAPPNCGGIHTNGCPIGQTGWQNCGHTLATVCTQTGCPRPTLQTQITCHPQAQAITGIVCMTTTGTTVTVTTITIV